MKKNDKQEDIIKQMTQIFYNKIFELDTKTLLQLYTDIYKELISRSDFASFEDHKILYEIYKQKLIEEGIYNV